MAENSQLGTKHLCSECGAKFYDLGKSKIVCPKCGTDPAQVAADEEAAEAKTLEEAQDPEEEDDDLDDEDDDLEDDEDEDDDDDDLDLDDEDEDMDLDDEDMDLDDEDEDDD